MKVKASIKYFIGGTTYFSSLLDYSRITIYYKMAKYHNFYNNLIF